MPFAEFTEAGCALINTSPGFMLTIVIDVRKAAVIKTKSNLGGWRVIETLGMKMTKLRSVHGFCAETAAATSILLSTAGGIPVSTV